MPLNVKTFGQMWIRFGDEGYFVKENNVRLARIEGEGGKGRAISSFCSNPTFARWYSCNFILIKTLVSYSW